MTRFAFRQALALLGLLVVGLPHSAGAQYFGRNKVQYEHFDFHIMRTAHFDLYFYPAESLVVHDAGRMAERWYTRHSDSFRHTFDRKSVVFYADQPDFQQTNVVGEELTEGTGGVTEGLRTRVVMPFTGIYADNDHVLGHELVHVFQYSVAEAGPGGLQRLNSLPLWLIEGMAEYFSLGRDNPLTAMWLRDAAEREKLPTIHQLNTDSRFFPYRYGQALWAYVGGRWGDRAVVDVYRTSLRIGFEEGIRRVLGVSTDSLSKDWIAATRRAYLPVLEGRTRPNQAGDPILQINRKSGEMNLAPQVSPDGKLVAFFARRGLFEIELFVADAQTGRTIKKLAGPTSNSHFDAITFISSSGAWSPDNQKFAFIAQSEGNHEIAILDVNSGNIERRIRVPEIGAISNIAWSPDGQTIAFSGQKSGIADLFLLSVVSGQVRQLTNDRYGDIQPTWSPDGKTIAFSSDRGPTTNFETMTFSDLQLATIDVATSRITVYSPFAHGKHLNPQYSPDGRSLFFISDQDGFTDIYRLEMASGAVSRVTRLSTGVSGITATSPALTVAPTTGRMLFSVFEDQGYAVYALDASRTVGEPVAPGAVMASAGVLPPGDTPGRATVTNYLKDPVTGLATGTDFTVAPYRSSFALDAVGQPALGVSAGGPFGTGVSGGVSFLFGDQLSDTGGTRGSGQRHRAGHRRPGAVRESQEPVELGRVARAHSVSVRLLRERATVERADLAGHRASTHFPRPGRAEYRVSVLLYAETRVRRECDASRLQHADPVDPLRLQRQSDHPDEHGCGVAADGVLRLRQHGVRRGQLVFGLHEPHSGIALPFRGLTDRRNADVHFAAGRLSHVLLCAADHVCVPRPALRPLRKGQRRPQSHVSALPRRGNTHAWVRSGIV